MHKDVKKGNKEINKVIKCEYVKQKVCVSVMCEQ